MPTAPEQNLIFQYLKGDLDEGDQIFISTCESFDKFLFQTWKHPAGGKAGLEKKRTLKPHVGQNETITFTILHPSNDFECFMVETPNIWHPFSLPLRCELGYRFTLLGYKIRWRDIEEELCIQMTDTKLHSQRKSKAGEGEEKRVEEDKRYKKRKTPGWRESQQLTKSPVLSFNKML